MATKQRPAREVIESKKSLLRQITREWYWLTGKLASMGQLPPCLEEVDTATGERVTINPISGMEVAIMEENMYPMTRREIMLIAEECKINCDTEKLRKFAEGVIAAFLDHRLRDRG